MSDKRQLAGRYRLVRELGAGSSGTVWLADDVVGGRAVAVKVATRSAEGAEESLRLEFELLSSLSHPHLLEVYEFGRDAQEGCAFLSMEHVDGVALDAALPGLTAEEALDLLHQACLGLGYQHARGLVHGDLKPENLLVARVAARPWLKLVDLGLAGPAGQGEAGVVRGTPRFSDPSVLAGHAPTERSDLYALGASFDEALRGVTWEVPRVLAEVVERLVADDEDTRYQSAAHALRDLAPFTRSTADEGLRARGAPDFVGRLQELGRLEADLQALLHGGAPPRVTLVEGPPGVGKSRLAEELARRAALEGARVVRGRGRAAKAGTWGALREVLHELGVVLAGEDRELAGECLALERQLARGHAAGGEEAGAERLQEVLQRVAALRPLLVLLDDAESLDGPPARWLAGLSWRRSARGLAFVLFADEPESSGSDADAEDDVLGALRAEPGTQRLALSPLGEAETVRLVRSLCPDAEARSLELVATLTRGHPAFATAAARVLGGAGSEDPDARARRILEALPRSLEEALERDFTALSPAARSLARDLSVHRAPVAPLVAAETSGLSAAALAPALEELLSSAILERRRGDGEVELAFASELLRRRLKEGLEPERRAAASGRALDALLRSGDGDPASLARLARDAGRSSEEYSHSLQAVRLALLRHEPRTALRRLERLAELAGGEPAAVPGELDELRGDACARLGLDAEAAGHFATARAAELDEPGQARLLRKEALALEERGRHEEAHARLEEALALRGSGADERALAHGLLGRVLFRLGRAREAELSIEAGLKELDRPDRDPVAADLWNDLGVLASERTDYERSGRRHRRALAIRELHGDLEGKSRSLTNLGNLALISGKNAEARRHYEEALELKRRFGNRQTLARSLSNLALLEGRIGNFGSAIERHEEALLHREELGEDTGRVFSLNHLAELWLVKAELGRAHDLASRALELSMAREAADRGRVAAVLSVAQVELALGRLAEAEHDASEALELSLRLDCASDEAQARAVRARVLLEEGAPERAAASELERALSILRTADEPYRLVEVLLVEARRRLRVERGGGEELAEEALELARELEAPLLVARAEHLLGDLAFVAGRSTEASERLHRALESATGLGALEEEWAISASLACFHEAAGRAERALLWVRRAVRIFRRVVERLEDPELSRAYLGHPARLVVLRRLEGLLG